MENGTSSNVDTSNRRQAERNELARRSGMHISGNISSSTIHAVYTAHKGVMARVQGYDDTRVDVDLQRRRSFAMSNGYSEDYLSMVEVPEWHELLGFYNLKRRLDTAVSLGLKPSASWEEINTVEANLHSNKPLE